MDFPRDYGFKGQWVSVTPVKPNPRIRSQSSDSNWVQSVDVNGGLVGNGDGFAQMPYRRLLGGPDPVGMGQMSLPNLLSHQISGRNGLEMMNSSHSSSNRNRFLLNEMMFSKPQYNLPVVHSFLTNLNSYPGNNQTFTAVGSEEMSAPATPVMMEKNWMERGNDLLLPPEIIDLVDDVESFGEVVQKQNETIRSYEDFRKQNEANTLQQSIVDGCFSSQYSQKQSEPATLQQSVVDGFFASQYHQKQNESTTLQQWIADGCFCSQYPQRQNKPSTLQQSIADGCFSSQYPQKQNEPDTLQQSIEDGCFNEPNRLQQSIEDGRVSSQQQEGEEMNNVVINSCVENQGIDLNKTPQQKPKRKKFTPKVLKERKPKRTPKPVATPKTAGTTTPNPTGKRKYVRKKKDLNLEETPLSTSTPVEQTVDADGRSRSKAVRRSLNFDLEDTQERDRSLFGQNGSQIHTQAREEVHAAVDIGGKMFGQNGLEIHTEAREEAHAAVETSESSSQREGLVDLENSLRCGVGFDLNSSKNQFATETTGRIPQTPNRPSQPCRQEETARARAMFQFEFRRMVSKLSPSQVYERGNGKMLQDARRISCEEGIEDTHENGNLVNGLYQVDSPEAADVQLNGAKRAHNLVNSAQVSSHTSIMRGFNITDRVNDNNINASSSTNPCLSVINKKRRTETGQKECTSKSSTLMTYDPCRWKSNDSTGNVSLVSTNADAPRLFSNEKSQALERMLTCNQAEKDKNKRVQNQSPTFLGDLSNSHNKVSTPTATSDHHKLDFNQPKTPEKVPILSSSNQESEVHGPQARVDVLVANQKKPKPRGRKKKEQIPVVNAKSCQIEQVSEGFVTEPQVVSKKKTQILKNHQNNSSWKVPASPRAFPSYSDLVDEIVRRLMHLNINDDFPQSALVPYAGAGGLMVSYQGPFNLVKKKKPRPRVDLDPESNRVWNLLMGKESVEAEQGTEVDKEKWWEEERRVFRGRVDSFIARMHLIQGDRRFSKWKGSVVDSVIGVFLTQNVSDHLSSSAFMCLAARFPPQSNGQDSNANNVETISSRSIVINDTWQEKVSDREFCEGTNKTEKMNNKETANSNESLESNDSLGINSEARNVGFSKENNLDYFYGREVGGIVGNESPDSASGTAVTVTSCTSAIEGEDRRSTEDVVSSQNSVASSHNSSEWAGLTIYPQLNSEAPNQSKYRQSNSEAPALIARGMGNGNNSFMELLHMAGTGRIATAEYGGGGGGRGIDWPVPNRNGLPDYVNGSGSSIHASPNSHLNQNQNNFLGLSCAPSPSYYYNTCSNSRFMGMGDAAEVVNNKGYESHLPYTSIGMNNTNINERMGRSDSFFSGSSASMLHNTLVAPIRADASSPISKNSDQLVMSSGRVISVEKHHSCCQSEASSNKIPTNTSLIHQQDGNAAMFAQRKKEAVKAQAQIVNHVTQTCSNVHDDNQRKNADAVDVAESNVRTDASTPQKVSTVENLNDASEKAKKVKPGKEKKSFDWDSLRRNTCQTGVPKRERGMETMDSLDYEALRNADVNEISNTIRERGMNNLLAERIKAFLNRLVEDHGSIDLEWLRDVPPDKAKDYLLSIRGLGLKSVECIRLLTLHNLAFPVDTNVGRICVRLGWVPLQPLPESLQLHLLEMYPIQETIQKYLWPRLCKLDQPTLYELHYQLITFGKVFCTKSKPNCNSCPMRGECKHFASAYASARLALPGPEEKSIVTSEFPISSESGPNNMACNRLPLPPQLEGPTRREHEQSPPRNCEPIIEEPASPDPEPECFETSEIDIEDAFYNDPDEIPTIKLNIKEFTQNLQNYFQENNLGLQDGDDMSKALVAISPEAASIPMPKLKNVNRLRTEHLVYELPDSHPLLKGMDEREAGDPSPYLLAIWTPGETAQSIEPTKAGCNAEGTGQLCDKSTCFSCNSIREAQSQTVRGTLLIPCRTANKGSFPLNGTYFQVNEVFADHFSSCNPIDVPRDWIWNLPRRTVYFGTSIPSIFKGLTTEGIQHCFWRGFVCVRGFDRVSRAPKPLFARLHFPASKTTRNKRAEAARRNEE